MIYFKNCKSIEDVKSLYKSLAKIHHPDKEGGNLHIMQQINADYDFITARFLKGSGKTKEEIDEDLNLSEVYKEKIQGLVNFDDIQIEITGTWIWVTGNTMAAKERLKELGFLWARKKVAWFFRTEENKVRPNKNPLSLSEIRAKYGSTVLKGGKYQKNLK